MNPSKSDGAALSGEMRLALAILEDAILTVRLTRGVRTARAYRLAAEAWAWLASRDRGHPFAFENLCGYLGLDAGWIRRELRSYGPPLRGYAAPLRGYAARRTVGSTTAACSRSSRPRTPATNDRQRAAS